MMDSWNNVKSYLESQNFKLVFFAFCGCLITYSNKDEDDQNNMSCNNCNNGCIKVTGSWS